jgi:hypothetical protein
MAVQACLRPGMAGPELDMSSALAVTRAYGVRPELAAPLISSAYEGVRKGVADRKASEGS